MSFHWSFLARFVGTATDGILPISSIVRQAPPVNAALVVSKPVEGLIRTRPRSFGEKGFHGYKRQKDKP